MDIYVLKLNGEEKIKNLSDLFTRYALFYSYQIKGVIIQKDSYGKPYLVNHKGIHFNLSNSHDYVVCAVSNKPCGIDIEMIKERVYLKLAKRYFTQTEYHTLLNMEETEGLAYFYEIWTMKEAYIKLVGKGLAIPLHSFYRENDFIVNDRNVKLAYVKQVFINEHYKMAVCSYSKIHENLIFVDLDKIELR